jgi:serine/threonine protein kinase/tetratricopeptide (TPR) repeat protein
VNAGDQYGPYHIIRLIGRGAMGDVYLAHHMQERRPVALKIVHKVNDREVLEAERLGAELQKRLRGVDPRVVPVNTYGEKDGDLFIEMDFIEGEDVSSLLSRGPVNPGFAVHVARELCEMLENLRAFTTTIGSERFAGIVHGDLKPGNVRIDKQNRVRVLDFGIAKALTHTRKYTINVFASTAYCSPERLDTQNMNTQSDLWSVGVLLYQMVTGALPFDEPTRERLERRIRSGQPPNPLPASCPAPLRLITYKMLARDPRLRYQTPREASEDLERFQKGYPVLAHEIPRAETCDSDATVRTAPPSNRDATMRTAPPFERSIDDRGVRSASANTPIVPKATHGNRMLGCLLAPAVAGVIVVAYIAVQINFWEAAEKLKTDLQAERMANLDQAWAEHQKLNNRSHLSVLLWGAERALKNRLVTAADEVIAEYRNSDTPSVRQPQWIEARNYVARALNLSPGDKNIKGRLRLCEGHVEHIDAAALRGSARQKKLNSAVNKFYEAADLRHWPDPYLALASLYVYDLGDMDKAEDMLKEAAHYGHRTGHKETAQLADGYRRRADRLWRESRGVTQLSDEERTYLVKAKDDYIRAEDLYDRAGLFGDTPRNRLQAIQGQQRVEQRLSQLQTSGVSQ